MVFLKNNGSFIGHSIDINITSYMIYVIRFKQF